MASKSTDIVKTKFIKVYDVDEFKDILNGVQVPACLITESHNIVDEQSVLRRLKDLTRDGLNDGTMCSCCGVGPFESRADQIAHYKNHWHTHNLKRKLFGKSPLSLGQFNSRIDDDSSVSGSDSEEDNENSPSRDLFAAATRHCKAFFTNKNGQVFCLYRCVLHHRKEELSTDGEGIAWVKRCQALASPLNQRWAVLMVSGGHFAGAVFAGKEPVLHKTLHSYTTRRGQGQSQSTKDQHSNLPRTAGASLRRYNQAQFLEHVQDIVQNWKKELGECTLILYRAVGSLNQGAIFGKNSPISRDDARVRQLPFPTRKPTYKEVRRVHETIAGVEVYDTMELFQKALIASTAKPVKPNTEPAAAQKKIQKSSPSKPVNRAKSRERPPRELPTQIVSSEDEGPTYIDSETPPDWIRTLSQQNDKRTTKLKDLLNDCALTSPRVSECSESEREIVKREGKKKKKKEKKDDDDKLKKGPLKIPANIKKMWKTIVSNENTSLETIMENWESVELAAACNTQDPSDGNTALHKAAIAAKPDMVTEILCAGGDPCIKNHLLQTPYAAAPHNDTRVAFRLFQAQHPDKFNYAKSQIPGPLTPEQLEQEKEKKLQQKRAKRQREKEKQIEKLKINSFLSLTDAEKMKTKESRCFMCAVMLPKTPFEYEHFKFCSIRCLQNHKSLRPLVKSV